MTSEERWILVFTHFVFDRVYIPQLGYTDAASAAHDGALQGGFAEGYRTALASGMAWGIAQGEAW